LEDQFQEQYRILQNNALGIVATWSISKIEPSRSDPSIAGRTILIDKRTDEFLFSGAYLGGPDNAQARGTCIRG
jgi:hypothetical protein